MGRDAIEVFTVAVLQISRDFRVTVDGEVVAKSERPKLLFETGLPTR